jgi:hypothetical protein
LYWGSPAWLIRYFDDALRQRACDPSRRKNERGEEKAKGNNALFKNRCIPLKAQNIVISNRNKFACLSSPRFHLPQAFQYPKSQMDAP